MSVWVSVLVVAPKDPITLEASWQEGGPHQNRPDGGSVDYEPMAFDVS